MKKLISILLVFILLVGFLESFPKYFIVETKENTTKPTDNAVIQEKHHGCVDSTGKKHKMGEVLDVDEGVIFKTVCGCSFIEKKCKWTLMNYDKEKVVNTEGECKRICHSLINDEPEPEPDEKEWLIEDCPKECSYHAKKGLILREETQNGMKSGNTTGKTQSGKDVVKHQGCVDSSGKKFKADEYMGDWSNIKFNYVPVCKCNDTKSSANTEKECRWQLACTECDMDVVIINTEEKCNYECEQHDSHLQYRDESDEDPYDPEWLKNCHKECSDYAKKGFIIEKVFQSKTEKNVSSKCCAISKDQQVPHRFPYVESCFEVKFDPLDLHKKDIAIDGMTFTKSHDRGDGDSYMEYTGEEYKWGKGIIKGYNQKNSSDIADFRMGLSDTDDVFTDFELNKCKNSFIFKQIMVGRF